MPNRKPTQSRKTRNRRAPPQATSCGPSLVVTSPPVLMDQPGASPPAQPPVGPGSSTMPNSVEQPVTDPVEQPGAMPPADPSNIALMSSVIPSATTNIAPADYQRLCSDVKKPVLDALGRNGRPVSATKGTLSPAPPDTAMQPQPAVHFDASVQGSVASALHQVTGEHILPVVQAQPSQGNKNFQSISISIDARVPPKLKAKIWANEFIEFGSLLQQDLGDTNYHIALSSNQDSKPMQCLEPTEKAKSVKNIDMWTYAFQLFVAVYASKYPSETPGLMKYGEVVRDLATRVGNWLYYDSNFRYLRQHSAASTPWDNTH